MNLFELNSKKYLSDLLPYDLSKKTNGSLRDSLKEYNCLLMLAQQALLALQNRDLEKFDALVGENACQIRAAKIALLFQTQLAFIDPLQVQLTSSLQKVEALSRDITALMKSGTALSQLLKKENLDLLLTIDEQFIIETFLLSLAKTVKPSKSATPLFRNDQAKPEELLRFHPGVSKGFANALVKKTRTLLSAASVAFVQEQTKLLKDEKLEAMCSQEFIIKHNNLFCAPMFWSYKALLLTAQKQGIPLIIYAKFKNEQNEAVNEECLFFKSNLNKKSNVYEELIPYPSDLEKSAIVVQGVVPSYLVPSKKRWKETIISQNLKVILAGAADHRQYPDEQKDQWIEKMGDDEFIFYKKMAKDQGYARSNPTTFYIQHVYPLTGSKLPNYVKKMRFAEQQLKAFLPEKALEEWPQRAVTLIMSNLEN